MGMVYLLCFLGVQIMVGLELLLHPRLEWTFKTSFLTGSFVFALVFVFSKLLTI
jgi:hypothetical protein